LARGWRLKTLTVFDQSNFISCNNLYDDCYGVCGNWSQLEECFSQLYARYNSKIHRRELCGKAGTYFTDTDGNQVRGMEYYLDGRLNIFGNYVGPGTYPWKMTSHLIIDCDHDLDTAPYSSDNDNGSSPGSVNFRSAPIYRVIPPYMYSDPQAESMPFKIQVKDGRNVKLVWEDDTTDFSWGDYEDSGDGVDFNLEGAPG